MKVGKHLLGLVCVAPEVADELEPAIRNLLIQPVHGHDFRSLGVPRPPCFHKTMAAPLAETGNSSW
jgi:hypothetical protein